MVNSSFSVQFVNILTQLPNKPSFICKKYFQKKFPRYFLNMYEYQITFWPKFPINHVLYAKNIFKKNFQDIFLNMYEYQIFAHTHRSSEQDRTCIFITIHPWSEKWDWAHQYYHGPYNLTFKMRYDCLHNHNPISSAETFIIISKPTSSRNKSHKTTILPMLDVITAKFPYNNFIKQCSLEDERGRPYMSTWYVPN